MGTRKTGCDLIVLGGTNCNEGSMDWLFGGLGNENFYVCQPASFYKSQQEIEKVNPLYAFKVATAYFRGQGLVPVFEDCHCRLIILRYGVGWMKIIIPSLEENQKMVSTRLLRLMYKRWASLLRYDNRTY